jgi:sugar phosphate isomerase/epimerase
MPRRVLFRIEPSSPPHAHELIECALASGFDGVELALTQAQSRIVTNEAAGPARTRPALSGLDNGFLARNFGGYQGRIRACAWQCATCDVSEALEQARALLTDLARLGVQVVNVSMPPLGRGAEGDAFPSYADALHFAYQLLRTLRFEAEETGIAIALEPAAGRCLLSPVELREIIDAADSWAVGACVDVLRISRIGCPYDWITTLDSRIHAVRLPFSGNFNGSSWEPSDETIDLPTLVRTLDSVDYGRVVILDGEGTAGASVAWVSAVRRAEAHERPRPVPDNA